MSTFEARDIWKTSCVMLGYWAILLTMSLHSAATAALVPWLLALGIPLTGLAGVYLWRSAIATPANLAYIDDLTGIGNRRAFMIRAREAFRRAGNGNRALILVDVDGLKAFNNQCGHQAGDELLVAVAERLRLSGPLPYRIGGDEFALVIDREQGEAVTSVLQELQPFELTFASCGHTHAVRCSYGYASTREHQSFDTLFGRADSRLGDYKRQIYAAGNRDERRAGVNPWASDGETAAIAGPAEAPDLTEIPSIEERRRVRAARKIS